MIASEYSPLIEPVIKAPIPDYTLLSQDLIKATGYVITVTSIFYKLIFLFMLLNLLTGGFDMFFASLDLL